MAAALPIIFLIYLNPPYPYVDYRQLPQVPIRYSGNENFIVQQPVYFLPPYPIQYFPIGNSLGGSEMQFPGLPNLIRTKNEQENVNPNGFNSHSKSPDNSQFATSRNETTTVVPEKTTDPVTEPNTETTSTTKKYTGYSLLVTQCEDGFVADDNGVCQPKILLKNKDSTLELERKKRFVENPSSDAQTNMIDSQGGENGNFQPIKSEPTGFWEDVTTIKPVGWHLTGSGCAVGYKADENGRCQKIVNHMKKEEGLGLNHFRKREKLPVNDDDFLSDISIPDDLAITNSPSLFADKGIDGVTLEDDGSAGPPGAIRWKRGLNQQDTPTRSFHDNQRTRTRTYSNPAALHSRNGNVGGVIGQKLRLQSRAENKTKLEKTPLDDEKNAASDGFGYITKECGKLVPGLVSDGAGGCTKPVKAKEKILQLDRKKRDTKTIFINALGPQHRAESNNFTIRIIVKGFNTRFTTVTTTEKSVSDDKAVANNGFGISSSRCNSLVPGLVSDGAGGCTKVVKGVNKRNKFAFLLKSGGSGNSFTEIDYDTSDSRHDVVSPSVQDDPDADII